MKKSIGFSLSLLLLLLPVAASAQTVNPNAGLIAVLTQLVQTLEAELQQLLAAQPSHTLIPIKAPQATSTVSVPLSPQQVIQNEIEALDPQEASVCNAATTAQSDEQSNLQSRCANMQDEMASYRKQLGIAQGSILTTTTTSPISGTIQSTALTALSQQLGTLQSQLQTCDNALNPSSGLGMASIANQMASQHCDDISNEMTGFIDEQGVIQQGGIITQTCNTSITSTEQQLFTLRQNAEQQEEADLTSGYISGQGLAQQIQVNEAKQEIPLLSLIQDNIYSCQD